MFRPATLLVSTLFASVAMAGTGEHHKRIAEIRACEDGELYVTADRVRCLASRGQAGPAIVDFSLADGTVLAQVDVAEPKTHWHMVDFSADGSRVAGGAIGGSYLWSADGTQIGSLSSGHLRFSGDGDRLVLSTDSRLKVLASEDGSSHISIDSGFSSSPPKAVAWLTHNDGTVLVLDGMDLEVWRQEGTEPALTIDLAGPAAEMDVSPDESMVAIAIPGKPLEIRTLPGGELLETKSLGKSRGQSASWSPDGKRVAVAYPGGLSVFEVGKRSAVLTDTWGKSGGSTLPVPQLGWGPTGTLVAVIENYAKGAHVAVYAP